MKHSINYNLYRSDSSHPGFRGPGRKRRLWKSISLIGTGLVLGSVLLLNSNCAMATQNDSENDSNMILLALLLLSKSSSSGSMNATEQEFHDLLNEHRTANAGCEALESYGTMVVVARNHSQDMHDRSFFDHTNPDGEDPFDRLADAGIEYDSAAENIAKGYDSPQSVLDGWLASSGHRANIENCNYTHHGIGYVEDGDYWTDVFAQNPR